MRITLTSRAAGIGRRVIAAGSIGVLVAGCHFNGLNSLDMPGTKGHDQGSYTITVELPDVTTLPQNSPVMVDDVTVGSVSSIHAVQRADGTYYAALKLSLDPSVRVPSNATVTVGQTTLLGSQHVELSAPQGQPAVGRLGPGSHIGLNHAASYPTTEQVLATLGVVVNKGNLSAVQDITNETYVAVANRAGSFTGLIPRLATLTSSLKTQTGHILDTADGLNHFASVLARNQYSLGRTLDTVPAALKVLNDNKAHIVDAFSALRKFALVASTVVGQIKDDFAADFKDLYPVVKSIADNLNDFVKSLDQFVTFPFVEKYIKNAARGDYLNVFATFDLTIRRLGESIFTTSPLDSNMKHLAEIVNPPDFLIGETANLSGQAADPFTVPPAAITSGESH